MRRTPRGTGARTFKVTKTEPKPAPKNLVIRCDGTGNEISENVSNILKLYRCLRKTNKTRPRQMVFCDAGVGKVTEPTI